METLVVKAVRPGPAFWKVSSGDSTVWVMGVPSSLPRGIRWNHDELKAHLSSAEPYEEWLGAAQYKLKELEVVDPEVVAVPAPADSLLDRQQEGHQIRQWNAVQTEIDGGFMIALGQGLLLRLHPGDTFTNMGGIRRFFNKRQKRETRIGRGHPFFSKGQARAFTGVLGSQNR